MQEHMACVRIFDKYKDVQHTKIFTGHTWLSVDKGTLSELINSGVVSIHNCTKAT